VSRLLLLVPSRGRPQNIARLWQAMNATCEGETTLLVGLDADDPRREDYPGGPEYVIREHLHQVVAWINYLSGPLFRDGYDFVGTIGDDNVPRTAGWDTAMMGELEQQPFAYGNDLYPFRPPGVLATHVFTRAEVIGALGYFGPPALRHSFVDDVWTAWGAAAGISFRRDVIIEHLHFTTGALHDDTYARSQAVMAADQAVYAAYCQDGLAADILKILAIGRSRVSPEVPA
jgi:hypothetical protein